MSKPTRKSGVLIQPTAGEWTVTNLGETVPEEVRAISEQWRDPNWVSRAAGALAIQYAGRHYFEQHPDDGDTVSFMGRIRIGLPPAYLPVKTLIMALDDIGEDAWTHGPEKFVAPTSEWRSTIILSGEPPRPEEMFNLPELSVLRQRDSASHAYRPEGVGYAMLHRGEPTAFYLGYADVVSGARAEARFDTTELVQRYPVLPPLPESPPGMKFNNL